MWFFEILLRHWILWSAATLYAAVFTPTVRRYFREVLSIRMVEHRVSRLHFTFAARVIVITGLFAVAPYLRHRLKERDRRAEEERYRQEKEQRRLEQESKKKVNEERAKLREDWLAKNSLVLYYHTVNGITAALTPTAYAACEKLTNMARRNGRWTKENVLLPSGDVFLFVDERGRRLFSQNHGTQDPVGYNWVSGWLTDLDELTDRYGVKLMMREDIFVPYVNETVLPFDQQMLRQRQQDYFRWLVLEQTPPEMYPIL